MEQRLSVITLGVKNLKKSQEFYEQGLGWVPLKENQDKIVFFQIGGLVFSLYPIELLAKDAYLRLGHGFGGITLAHNVHQKTEVDAILENAKKAGGKIIKSAQDVFGGGYSGYFTDLDGYPFEIAWNPFWTLNKKGEVNISSTN